MHAGTWKIRRNGKNARYCPRCCSMDCVLVRRWNKFFVQSDIGLSKMIGQWKQESIKTVSFAYGGLSEMPNYLAGCSRLSTLFLQDNPLKKIPKEFFLGLKELRVLDLSRTNLESLPSEVGKLINLRLLNLTDTWELKSIEAGAMSSRLSSLEVLDMNGSGYTWKLKGEVEEGSATLEELVHLECLSSLQICVNSIASLHLDLTWLKGPRSFYIYIWTDDLRLHRFQERNERVVELHGHGGDFKQLSKCGEEMLSIATHLYFEGCLMNGIWEVAKSIQLHRLKSLSIEKCRVKRLVGRGGAIQHCVLPNLEELSFARVTDVENIWEGIVSNGGGRSFPKLRKFSVFDCHELKSLIPYDFLQQLDNLEEISVDYCSDMEEIITAKVAGENTLEIVATNLVDTNILPKLRILRLHRLFNLKCVCKDALTWPSLEGIEVSESDRLKRLPLSTCNAIKLRVIRGREKWWERLEWEDDDTKLHFQQHFKAYKSQLERMLPFDIP
ncbi:disease resistance protein At4g27190-like [Tasmannia lanceolata]|uniref:disease resistance protein At4g27190-like n=1 Tax=Tasmannia lanceolata TaxID=3420 RepID=UPI0040640332